MIMKQYFLKNIFHPYFLCLYIILNAINVIVEFDFKEFFGLTLIFFFFAFLLSYTSQKYAKVNKYKFSYLLTCLIYIFFFTYEITSFFSEITFISFRLRYTMLTLTLLLFAFSFLLFKSKREFLKINLYLNLLFFFFCGFEIYNFVKQKLNQSEPKLINNNTTKPKPNIYFLMIDGYANNKSLKKYWGYDNSSFTDSLQKLGFKYIEDSKSDYLFTIQTVASMLNLKQIDKKEENNTIQILKSIRINTLTKFLIKENYTIENLSIFSIVGTGNRFLFWFGKNQNNVLSFLFSKSLIGNYLRKKEIDNSYGEKKSREAKINDELRRIIKRKNREKPVFVFYHSLQVHHPFSHKKLFDSYTIDNLMSNLKLEKIGRQTFGSKKMDEYWMKLYIDGIKISNFNTINNVKDILKNEKNCIVFLFSDHGFRLATDIPIRLAREEAYSNFIAIYNSNDSNFKLSSSNDIVGLTRDLLNEVLR